MSETVQKQVMYEGKMVPLYTRIQNSRGDWVSLEEVHYAGKVIVVPITLTEPPPDERGLSDFRLDAKRHWEKYLPRYYQKLVSEGRLHEELENMNDRLGDMILDLIPELRLEEALEIILPQTVYLPPEEGWEDFHMESKQA